MSGFETLFAAPFVQLGSTVVTFGGAVAAAGAVALMLLVIMAVLLVRSGHARRAEAMEAARLAREADMRVASILQAQSEMQGRMGALAEVFSTRQSELNKAIGERLDGMTSRLGRSIIEQTRSTHENLARLQERLAVIDTAQTNIQSLTGQVVQLQEILSNKQTRGAFGQSRMETIIADGLPAGAYEFQATLSNGNRPDCVIRMPNGTPPLVIDAKFPLEAWNLIRASEGAEAQKLASQAFRRDVEVHIRDIAQKYLIQGETQDTAFMFVPSESVFAEIHENYEAIVQRAFRSRIVIVSPSLLMLSIQVIQSILKDARMREQAHLIQGEVVRLMEDVSRLDDRVRKLQTHFGQAARDVEDILVSSGKVTRRGQKIEALEFVADDPPPPVTQPVPRSADSRTGNLKLRVVDEE